MEKDVQEDLFEDQLPRRLLDQLLVDSKLYKRRSDYKELLEFVVQLREFAPFNSMLFQIQKPGLRFAASEHDWISRFGRTPKPGARPLLIMWPFGAVALVYDVVDTEGRELPEDVASFPASGDISVEKVTGFINAIRRINIETVLVDAGDAKAGSICVTSRAATKNGATKYRKTLNQNHSPPVQFCTLAHELGHLCLGHLGEKTKLKIPQRRGFTHAQCEIEAESVAYIVCMRNGVTPKSQTYLTNFVEEDTNLQNIEVYQVIRAAGQVEGMLGLAIRSRFNALIGDPVT